jgi:subtilase family serine protease
MQSSHLHEYKRRFWPPAGEIEELSDWLSNEGFDVLGPTNAGLEVTGTVATVERACATTIVKSHDGYYYANTTEPQIPARFADVVELITGLDTLDSKPRSNLPFANRLKPVLVRIRIKNGNSGLHRNRP